MIDRFLEWWRKITCRHEHLVARMKWVEEYVIYYEECPECDREFYE